MGQTNEMRPLRPLQRFTRGEREARVTSELKALNNLSDPIILSCSCEQDPERQLAAESLVAVVRYFLRKGDEKSAWQAFEQLMKYADNWIYPNHKKRGFSSTDYPDIAGDIYEKMRESIWETGEKEEYWEYRFWVALEREGCTVMNKWSDRRSAEQSSMRSGPNGEWDALEHIAETARRGAVFVPIEESHNGDAFSRFVEWQALDDALARLPSLQRMAWYLRNWKRWPIDSPDPDTPSIARALNRTPRSVSNYLRAAEVGLAAMLGAEAE